VQGLEAIKYGVNIHVPDVDVGWFRLDRQNTLYGGLI
jgi:hypothetical protein